ncbi:transposase [Rhizobium leguminosarum]|uniref:Transposase family protein n=1 Tax=Rhizobium leguminosarum TaxID=384 RepID=A0A2Z4YVM0_RHILE|nr:Transposase family protein [Rhizobium leguminosarum]
MTKHPIEVITSVERRRRWSREDKERLVAACFEPDAVISEIARAAGVSDKLTPSGVSSVGRCIADRRFTNCELLCLRLALELETSI